MLYLTGTHGPSKSMTWPLEVGKYRLGRDLDCAIQLEGDSAISRQQCELRYDGELLVMLPISERTPTLLNGERVNEPVQIQPGDVITVAFTALVISTPSEAGTPIASSPKDLRKTPGLNTKHALHNNPSADSTGKIESMQDLVTLFDLSQQFNNAAYLSELIEDTQRALEERFSPQSHYLLCTVGDQQHPKLLLHSPPSDAELDRHIIAKLNEAMNTDQGSLLPKTISTAQGQEVRSTVIAPLSMGGKCIGALGIMAETPHNLYEKADLNFLSAMGRALAICITLVEQREALTRENKRLKKAQALAEKHSVMAHVDALTGIPNRRAFDKGLETEWKRAQREQIPIGLILIDIDHFKLYNDNYGHQAGDGCLQEVAGLLDSCDKRAGDLLARYGGEEFVLVLPNIDAPSLELFANKLCQVIHEANIPHEYSSASHAVTISVGAAVSIPEQNVPAQSIIEHADQALYTQKKLDVTELFSIYHRVSSIKKSLFLIFSRRAIFKFYDVLTSRVT